MTDATAISENANYQLKTEAELIALAKEKRKNQTPRRKMYAYANDKDVVLLLSGTKLSQERFKKMIPSLEEGLSAKKHHLGEVNIKMYPSNLVRLYPDARAKRQLNREYRNKYYERNPEKKELTEAQKRKRKEYNERPEVKKRKLENNRYKRMFLQRKLEENADEYTNFLKQQKNIENGVVHTEQQVSYSSTEENSEESEEDETLRA